VGAASFCLLYRLPFVKVLGIDIQPELISLAEENAKANGFLESFFTLSVSLKEVKGEQFDHIMSNPPYFPKGRGTASSLAQKHLSHYEETLSLKGWIQACAFLLRPKGSLTLIYTVERLPEVLKEMEGFGEITLFPLWPKAGMPAKRIIIRARKGIQSASSLKSGLILHTSAGSYTKEADEILREGKALVF